MASGQAPLLFLDFDGVLHPASAHQEAPFSRAPLLETALAGWDVQIVVSSSWRFGYTFDELRGFLPGGLADRVIATTGDVHFGEHARYHEILGWLHDHGAGPNWRTLDDSAFEFPKGCPELLLCDPNVGIDPDVADRLHWWLEQLARPIR